MVSESTQDLAFGLLDASQEYSTKLLLLILAVIYLVVLNLWANKLDNGANWELLVKFFVKIFSAVYFFTLPLFVSVMLFRTYELIELTTLLFWSYVIMSMIGGFIVTIFGWEKFMVFIGYPTLAPRLTKRGSK